MLLYSINDLIAQLTIGLETQYSLLLKRNKENERWSSFLLWMVKYVNFLNLNNINKNQKGLK